MAGSGDPNPGSLDPEAEGGLLTPDRFGPDACVGQQRPDLHLPLQSRLAWTLQPPAHIWQKPPPRKVTEFLWHSDSQADRPDLSLPKAHPTGDHRDQACRVFSLATPYHPCPALTGEKGGLRVWRGHLNTLIHSTGLFSPFSLKQVSQHSPPPPPPRSARCCMGIPARDPVPQGLPQPDLGQAEVQVLGVGQGETIFIAFRVKSLCTKISLHFASVPGQFKFTYKKQML